MRNRLTPVVGTAVLLLSSLTSYAEVKTAVARNPNAGAAPAFRFDDVPPPARSDAAAKAKATVVDGTRDPNGGPVETLTDGRVPRGGDEPRANFFFAPGGDGGRVLLDLGEAIEVKQVNTYSRHPAERGPQVYTLWAADGTAADFNPQPKRGTDPAACGWTRLAAVDTRPKEGEFGGQYGVSVSDSAGGALGKYRYLLFDVTRTSDRARFANTFFSEIDVIDRNAPAVAEAAVEEPAPPAERTPPIVATAGDGKYEIAFDVSETPDLKEWVDTKLKPVCVTWYPMIVEMLPSEGYTAPARVTVTFEADMRGVAYARGTSIHCAANWFRQNLEGEAVGAVVHELVHVVQQYGGRRRAEGAQRNPGWLVEGLADYIRWFLYEPQSARPRPNPARANYNDSYRTTGHFLNYVLHKYDKDLIKKLNAAMREGKYGDDLWKQWTGKTAEELGQEWKESLRAARKNAE